VPADRRLTAIELCAGAGGQAIGLERAGFEHVALVELDHWACETLRSNRPSWPVIEGDIKRFEADGFENLSLVAAGVPCPPFSVAGKRLGEMDDRDLFPAALDVVERSDPRAVMIENVRGLLDPIFDSYRELLRDRLEALGYRGEWRLLSASDYGVPQLRPRAVLVALKAEAWPYFAWPEASTASPPTVGKTLRRAMGARGWAGATDWARKAAGVAPTLVGGSKKHGGPDLGPTRAKKQWAALGVNAHTLAEEPPGPDHEGMPRLTVAMAAMVQGFPASWKIAGRKTAAYRQVGNAFPPPVAEAVGRAIRSALEAHAAAVPFAIEIEESRDKRPVGLAS
jgi:DNA (cytosine-5)-methyltransferase 1